RGGVAPSPARQAEPRNGRHRRHGRLRAARAAGRRLLRARAARGAHHRGRARRGGARRAHHAGGQAPRGGGHPGEPVHRPRPRAGESEPQCRSACRRAAHGRLCQRRRRRGARAPARGRRSRAPRPRGARRARAHRRQRAPGRGHRGDRRAEHRPLDRGAGGAGRYGGGGARDEGCPLIAVTAAEMRALDRWTIEHGTPGHVLMERAGAGAARTLRERLHRPRGPVAVVCGRGNNGGDGFVVARHLRRARVPVEVWLAARPEEVRGDAARMLAAWRRARGAVRALATPADVEALARRLVRAAAVVDALFGTGLNAPVTGVAAAAIAAINAAGAPVLAVDIASGLSADTGAPLGAAVRATMTATFGYPKVGQLMYPGVEHTGLLAVVDN